jgi:hypothetical protein
VRSKSATMRRIDCCFIGPLTLQHNVIAQHSGKGVQLLPKAITRNIQVGVPYR